MAVEVTSGLIKLQLTTGRITGKAPCHGRGLQTLDGMRSSAARRSIQDSHDALEYYRARASRDEAFG